MEVSSSFHFIFTTSPTKDIRITARNSQNSVIFSCNDKLTVLCLLYRNLFGLLEGFAEISPKCKPKLTVREHVKWFQVRHMTKEERGKDCRGLHNWLPMGYARKSGRWSGGGSKGEWGNGIAYRRPCATYCHNSLPSRRCQRIGNCD